MSVQQFISGANRTVRWRWLAALTGGTALFASLAATNLSAQPAAFDTTLLSSATVGQMLDGARAGDSLVRFAQWLPAVHERIQQYLRQLDRPDVRSLHLDVVGNDRAALGVVARVRRPKAFTAADVESLDSLAALMQRVLPSTLRDSAGLSEDAINNLLDPREAYVFARRARSIAESTEKLRRFERKYGPGAPRLNAAEVVLNYAAQWVPGFRPNNDGWPASLEVIASYVPTYVTIAEGDARAVTVAELGVRRYLWREGWGPGAGGWLRPGYLSFGLALAGPEDGAFTSPLNGTSRLGGFVAWGDLKLAVIGGRASRVLITRQIQLVPFGF